MGIANIIYSCRKKVFFTGFVIGVVLAVLLNKNENVSTYRGSCEKKTVQRKEFPSYSTWLKDRDIIRKPIEDYSLVNGDSNVITEAQFLENKVFILCAVFVYNVKNAIAVKNTWGKHCNEIVYFGVKQSVRIPVVDFKPRNSFHFLCDCINYIVRKFQHKLQWTLFVHDDIYAIPENLRYFVAPLDYNLPYYLGHTLTFWGQIYNMGEAGYVLSKSAMLSIHSKFNTTVACQSGGKVWKNEDFYLGKNLANMDITTNDTRDNLGRNRFLGYNLHHLLFPGRLSKLSGFWKKSVYPVTEGLNCCSDMAITFNGVEGHKLYLYDYFLNHLRVFKRSRILENKPAPTPYPEETVWKDFLKEQGKENETVSASEFYELWINKISAPDTFNAKLRQEHINSVATGFANMSNILESMLSAVRANDSEHEV